MHILWNNAIIFPYAFSFCPCLLKVQLQILQHLFFEGMWGWTWYLYTLMLTRYTMKYVVQKLWKTCDKYRIVGATALDPQNKIKRIYSFECSARCCNPSGNGPITSASPPPCDFTIDIYQTISRTKVEVYEADNAIDNVALRREVDRRPQVESRLGWVIIIEFVNLVVDTIDGIRRVDRNSRQEKR